MDTIHLIRYAEAGLVQKLVGWPWESLGDQGVNFEGIWFGSDHTSTCLSQPRDSMVSTLYVVTVLCEQTQTECAIAGYHRSQFIEGLSENPGLEITIADETTRLQRNKRQRDVRLCLTIRKVNSPIT